MNECHECFELMDDLESVMLDMQASLTLWNASRTMEIDEDDRESADTLRSIFGERIKGEIERLEEAYTALHAFYVKYGKLGF